MVSSQWSAFRFIIVEVGTPVARRPPHRSRRAVFPHRALQPGTLSIAHRKVGQFGSVYRTALVACVSFAKLSAPLVWGRWPQSYYELIRLPRLPLPPLLVVETAYPLGSRNSCGGTLWGLLGSVYRLPRAPRS